ncbi:MAG: hypothetical protein E7345_04215 [Clostridiales bacterium]|nr:hypothetical protein [Clostridiales bacterium]
MIITEYPLFFLIVALGLLILLLIFFKLNEFFIAKKQKKVEKNKGKPSAEKEKTASEEKKTNVTQDDKTSKNENSITNTKCNGYNYLHDRFVDNPTSDDIVEKDKLSSMFLSEDDYLKIKNEEIHIEVKSSDSIEDKLANAVKTNKAEREKLLDEFNNLSREMKLLLIENILKKS